MAGWLDRIREIAAAQKSGYPIYDLHPELLNRIPIMRVFSDQAQGQTSGEFGRAALDYGRHVWVHKAIKIIADNIAPLRVEVVQGTGEETEQIDNHPFQETLEAPNPEQSSADIWKQWVTDMMLGGEEGFEVVYGALGAAAVELWARQPHVFVVNPGSGGKRYQRVESYELDDQEGDPYLLPPEEFIHFKFYNPQNIWRGIAPITAVRMGIVIDQLAQAWSRLFFKNSARPDLVAIPDPDVGGFTAKERDEIELKLRSDLQGPGGWHSLKVLPESVKDIKKISHASTDIEWLEQRKFARDEVGAIFGVPDEIMGYGKDTYENFKFALWVLWVLTLVPLISFRDNKLTHWCKRNGILQTGERIQTDVSQVPELQEDFTEKLTQGAQLFKLGYSMNSINERLGLGMDPVEGGDIGYQPFSMIPIGESRSQTGSNGGDENQRALKDWRYGQGAPPRGSREHEILLEKQQRWVGPFIPRFQRKLKKFWQRQQIEVGRKLRSSQELGRGKFREIMSSAMSDKTATGKLSDNARSLDVRQRGSPESDKLAGDKSDKTHGHMSDSVGHSKSDNQPGQQSDNWGMLRELQMKQDRIPPLNELFNLELEVARFQEEFGPEIMGIIESVGTEELAAFGLEIAFDVERPEVIGAFNGLLSKVSQKTQQTVWFELIEIFEVAEAEGLGIPAIMERLSGFYGDKKSDWQTERIARTTTTGASNSGAMEAWAQSGVVGGREWISALQPKRTRDEHWDAHGQRVRLRESFWVMEEYLQYPGDPNGLPENIINCLCGTSPVLIEEMGNEI